MVEEKMKRNETFFLVIWNLTSARQKQKPASTEAQIQVEFQIDIKGQRIFFSLAFSALSANEKRKEFSWEIGFCCCYS
jgi:hypothetical protein